MNAESQRRQSLPRRALLVSQNDNELLKLIETQGLVGNYVVLGYCWGGPQTPVTDQSTIKLYLEKLDEKALPQTIRNALEVTRELGFQYL